MADLKNILLMLGRRLGFEVATEVETSEAALLIKPFSLLSLFYLPF